MTRLDDAGFDVIDTPEGRAVYPFGRWGNGYLADAATERRLSTYIRWMPGIIVASFTAQSLARHLLVHVSDFVGIVAAWLAFCAFHYIAVKTILRKTARAVYRPRPDELLRLRLARSSRTAMAAAHWCGLIVFVAIAVMTALLSRGIERWSLLATCAAFISLAGFGLWRLRQIPD